MANITNVNELWGRKWRFKDNTPSPSEFSLRNSVTGVKFATFYLGEQVKDVYQTDNSVGKVGITTQGTFIRIGVSESSFTYAYAASGWVGKPAILEFIDNTENYTLSCTNESNFITWFNENATEYVPPLNEWAEGVANKVRKLTGKTDKFKLLDLAKELDNVSTGIDTSDATATPNDMLLGKTAYVDGKKIEGTIETWNGETNSDVNVENVVSVNGLIGEYKVLAGENVNAGDFVEFINNIFNKLNSYSYSCYESPSCILLESNKVFIAHPYSSSRYLYGTIVEINGTEITATSTQLNSTSNSCYRGPNCILLENNKVFIAHPYSNNLQLYATIVEINGTEMTATTTTQLSSINNSCYYFPSCILLENNKLFITHSQNNYLYATIVEINGAEMTSTTVQLSSTSNSCGFAPRCILLEENKVFIAHSQSNRFYGTIATIDGTTITAKTSAINSTYGSLYEASNCILLEPNKVFIAHAYNNKQLYATIVTIDGTTMTATTTQLDSTNDSCYDGLDCVLLEPNKIFVAHNYSYGKYLYATIVEINGTEMAPTTIMLNDSSSNACNYYPSCVLLENNKVFMVHAYGAALSGTIYIGDCVIPMNDIIEGIAKTSGTGGETIQVFVPNTGV